MIDDRECNNVTCVCVCVCERERERESYIRGGKERDGLGKKRKR